MTVEINAAALNAVQADASEFQITLKPSGHTFKAAADETILEAALRQGIGLPIGRLHQGTPALALADDVFTNHIHADDLALAALQAAYRALPNRIYNIVDDSDMYMGDYFDIVADHFKLPRPPRVKRAEAASQIGPAMLSFMSESRRIGNTRLTEELGFLLRYPTVNDFLRQLKPT